jgi:hypothetical protein
MLSREFDEAIAEQELRRDNVGLARRLLEGALEVQLRALAQARLADLVLTRRPVNDLDWWLQYLSTLPHVEQYRINTSDVGFVRFREGILADIAAGRLRRITRRSFSDVRIRILGGHAHVWEDDRINRLLAAVGSSMRLMTVNSTTSEITSELSALLDLDASNSTVDLRFIYGRIAPLSVSMMGAQCFQFEQEIACAPDCVPSAGFADGMRTVVRETILRVEIESEADASTETPVCLADRALRVRLHEDGHVLDRYHGQLELLSAKQFWPEFVEPRYWSLLRDDVCRYAIAPRSLEDMTDFVERFFGTWVTRNSSLEVLRGSAQNIVDRLCDEGRLDCVAGGGVRCHLYDENKMWNIPP